MMNNTSTLTAEQKARIEHNRRQALERLKARKDTESSETDIYSTNNPVTKILPAITSSYRVNPYPIHCTIELVNEDRFLVKTSSYDPKVVAVYRKIPSATYSKLSYSSISYSEYVDIRICRVIIYFFTDASTRHWSFRLTDYDQLIKGLDSLKKYKITCSKIPQFVIIALREDSPNIDEKACLEQIDDKLVNTLLDFQKSGICFGISKKGRCMIGDDMGLGKSRQALAIADFYRDDWPLLIVTNASTRQFWAKEIEDLLSSVTSADIRIFQETRDDDSANNKVVICSYNNLQTSVDSLMRTTFGVIIFDESHNLKNEVSNN
jgi:SWI/SNF-related matrix-associated actin-dependent regulator 1 of chromatin subfamily A